MSPEDDGCFGRGCYLLLLVIVCVLYWQMY